MRADELVISQHLQGKKVEYQIAHPESFIDQLKWMNAMYIRGGETKKLIELLSQSPGWEKELEGKTVAGGSAGAIALGKYSYDLDNLGLEEGLGLVTVKVLVHYRSNYNAPNIDWDKAEVELKNYKEDLPLLKLAEGEFRVIEQ